VLKNGSFQTLKIAVNIIMNKDTSLKRAYLQEIGEWLNLKYKLNINGIL
jgi:hypothetical protein